MPHGQSTLMSAGCPANLSDIQKRFERSCLSSLNMFETTDYDDAHHLMMCRMCSSEHFKPLEDYQASQDYPISIYYMLSDDGKHYVLNDFHNGVYIGVVNQAPGESTPGVIEAFLELNNAKK